jgi:hypothetical protein
VDEWDAQGEAIAALVAHYRFSHDRAWLAGVYPSVASAARFLDALRGRTLTEDPETRSLLPANMSAEDLGSAAWHHYWDDLWAIAGDREAAFAASEMGQTADAADLLTGERLAYVTKWDALEHAIKLVLEAGEHGGRDRLKAATPALWPTFPARAESSTLLSDSFLSLLPRGSAAGRRLQPHLGNFRRGCTAGSARPRRLTSGDARTRAGRSSTGRWRTRRPWGPTRVKRSTRALAG